jgi:hypothetical protein
MAVPRLARRSTGSSFGGAGRCACLLVALAALAVPAAASAASPAEALLQRATQTTGTVAEAAAGRAGAALPNVRRTVDSTVQQVTAAEPVRSVVETARRQLEPLAGATVQAPRRVVEAATAGIGQSPLGGSATSPGEGGAGGLDPDGSIGRGSTRHGAPASAGNPAALPSGLAAALMPTIDLTAVQPESSASSSAARSGDDGGPGDGPLPGPTGTDIFGGPAGIALLGFAILTGLLLLAPRFRSRLLHMTPARHGLVACLTPIERPG